MKAGYLSCFVLYNIYCVSAMYVYFVCLYIIIFLLRELLVFFYIDFFREGCYWLFFILEVLFCYLINAICGTRLPLHLTYQFLSIQFIARNRDVPHINLHKDYFSTSCTSYSPPFSRDVPRHLQRALLCVSDGTSAIETGDQQFTINRSVQKLFTISAGYMADKKYCGIIKP